MTYMWLVLSMRQAMRVSPMAGGTPYECSDAYILRPVARVSEEEKLEADLSHKAMELTVSGVSAQVLGLALFEHLKSFATIHNPRIVAYHRDDTLGHYLERFLIESQD